MKIGRKMALIITTLVIGLLASCASTGEGATSTGGGGGYMPLAKGEKVLGNVETTFVVRNGLNPTNDTDAINAQAYEELREVAQQPYLSSGLKIDIRDIVVEGGRMMDDDDVECRAYGKVIEAH
ncbi:hypothetical protein FACS1894147_10440 [Spirochaetia bacterium]|nr:hypothetical protein FACS1894147_10440 [Spirochaetia bacterium]